MRRGVPDTLDSRNHVDQCDEFGKVDDIAQMIMPTIGVHILPKQVDLFHTAVGEVGNFGNHIVNRAGDLFTAGVGDYAKRAVLTATFHDRHKGSGAVGAWLRQSVEFLDLWKGNVYNSATT